LDFEAQQWLFMLEVVLNKPRTAKTYRSVTDTEVMKMVLAPLHHDGGAEGVLKIEKNYGAHGAHAVRRVRSFRAVSGVFQNMPALPKYMLLRQGLSTERLESAQESVQQRCK
jgi:hypothetical protein